MYLFSYRKNKRAVYGNTSIKRSDVKMPRKKVNLEELEPEERLKYEIAEELGLLDRVLESGWRDLTAKETGRIGGLMTKKKRERYKDSL